MYGQPFWRVQEYDYKGAIQGMLVVLSAYPGIQKSCEYSRSILGFYPENPSPLPASVGFLQRSQAQDCCRRSLEK